MTELTKELTQEEIDTYDAKAEALAKVHNVSKVHPVVQINPYTLARTVCYLREPNYTTKLRIMDKATTGGVYSAADELREALVLKEESDPITYSEAPESDIYKLGVVDQCLVMIERLQNQFKKK